MNIPRTASFSDILISFQTPKYRGGVHIRCHYFIVTHLVIVYDVIS